MAYDIAIKRAAEKELRDLPAESRKRVVAAILKLGEDPTAGDVRKLQNRDGYRLRVGDYRILFTRNDEQQSVMIFAIGHRRDVYR